MSDYRNAAAIAAEHGGKKVGDRYRLACPAHGGTGPNLAIWDGDRPGRIGAVCHSRGCDYGDILDALGVAHELPDHRGEPHHVTTYYTAAGEPRPVYRTDGPGGKRVWGEGSPVGTLVKLWPCAGADATEPVVLCEGEKAAAAVQGAGWTAASWRGGTGTVASVDFAPLATRDVILWPDADPQGRKAMETAAAALRAHRCRIVTLEAPGDDGSDAADLGAANIRARLEAVDWGAVAPAEHAPAMWIEGDPWSEWDEGTDAMAGRILRYYADRLLAVQFPGGYWQMFTAGAAGVWREDDALLRSWCDELARDWWASAGDLRTNTSIARAAQRWTTKRGQDDVLSEAGFGPAIEQLRRRNILPPDLTIAEHTQIDPTGRYVGCVNGVVDLDTGALVEGATARALFVTKAVAAFYRPELADDPNGAVYELLGRMSDDDRRWLLEAAGHALRGEPSRRVYLLQGPAGGGKSTILRALLAVVGEYGASLSETTLSSRAAEQTGRPTTELAPLGERRLVTLVEPQGTLAIGRLKKASGEDPITFRRHYARAEETRTGTATVFIAGNAGQIPRLPFEDDAVEERVRVLTVPAIPADERRAGLGKRFEEGGDVRDSLFALLVKHARKGSPPDDSPSVADARRALKREMIGPGGEWLLTAIVPEPHGRVTTDQLWQAAKAAGGGEGDPWGLTRRRLRELVKSLHKLPPARRMKVAGKFSHGWDGWRLASEDEVDAAIRELEPAADPKVIIIKHVAGDIPIEMPSGNTAIEPMRLPVHDRTRAWELADEMVKQGGKLLPPEHEGQEPLPAAVPEVAGPQCPSCDQADIRPSPTMGGLYCHACGLPVDLEEPHA